MCKKTGFYICKHCGNIVKMINNSGVPIICCGEPMNELVANAKDAAHEKHVPVVRKKGDTVIVSVGETAHPMSEEHWIQWAGICTENGFQIKHLTPEDKPEARFSLTDGDTAEEAFAYCNLHGLWKIAV